MSGEPGSAGSGPLTQVLAAAERKALGRLERWDPRALLNTAEADVIGELLAEATFEPAGLQRARASLQDPTEDSRNRQTDIAGDRARTTVSRLSLSIPLTGDRAILAESLALPRQSGWAMAATQPPRATPRLLPQPPKVKIEMMLLGPILRLDCYNPADAAEAKAHFDAQLDLAEQRLSLARAEVDAHNQRMADLIPRAVARQRREVAAELDSYASIGFPIKRRADIDAYHVPVTRKKITLGAAAGGTVRPWTPEPALAGNDYEAVLEVLRSARNALERSPSTTSKLDEPELRDILLVLLNAQFEGRAAGEVFNGSGKTDILIRQDDRNVFIGECKILRHNTGVETVVAGALDQLFGYLTWRDTKAALLLLIRDMDVPAVVSRACREIERHPNYTETGEAATGERYDFVMHAAADKSREIRLAVLPFLIAAKQPQRGAP
ncbi:MAG: hypothetical protein ACRDOI_40890 [Trebonia sp.]